MYLSCIDDTIPVWRNILTTITSIPLEMILNGESIRGPEFVTIKNGQKVPIGYDENFIVFYIDPIDDINVVDSYGHSTSVQSYELHLIIYGRDTKKMSQKVKSNIYTEGILDILRDNGIGLLSIPSVENTSNFMVSQTYVLRTDLRIRFNCVFKDTQVIKNTIIKEVETQHKEI